MAASIPNRYVHTASEIAEAAGQHVTASTLHPARPTSAVESVNVSLVVLTN